MSVATQYCLLPHNTDCLLPHNTDFLLPHNTDCLLPHNTDYLLPQNSLLPHNTDCLLPHNTDCLIPHNTDYLLRQNSLLPHNTDCLLPHNTDETHLTSASTGCWRRDRRDVEVDAVPVAEEEETVGGGRGGGGGGCSSPSPPSVWVGTCHSSLVRAVSGVRGMFLWSISNTDSRLSTRQLEFYSLYVWAPMYVWWGAGIAQWLERRTRDW